MSATPRSTQGNYTLAYPSKLSHGDRRTNIYFRSAPAWINYRFGSDSELAAPWVELTKAAAPAFLIFAIAVLARKVDVGDRLGALLAAFLVGVGLSIDLAREFADLRVYGAKRSWIQSTVIAFQVLVAADIILAIVGITANEGVLAVSGIAGSVLAVAALLTGILGLRAHSRGYWHNYRCDHSGCETRLRWRKGRPECHFTGRVFCDQHIKRKCRSCIHGPDLGRGALTTGHLYGSEDTPCGCLRVHDAAS